MPFAWEMTANKKQKSSTVIGSARSLLLFQACGENEENSASEVVFPRESHFFRSEVDARKIKQLYRHFKLSFNPHFF